MHYKTYSVITFLLLATFCHVKNAAASDVLALEEIVVTAELLERDLLALPNSVTVISDAQAFDRVARQLDDLLNLAPNVNYATGASRGRFVQIRGIGERSEFQEPIINSVGILVDGIDLTGVGLGATALDIKQLEVLRGPQGTLYGANALAGLINVVTNEPVNEFAAGFSAAYEDYNGRDVSAWISDSLSEDHQYRLSVRRFTSDGFIENVFLNRDDTNNFDEISARLKVASDVNEQLQINTTVFYADINNGYDAFSLDNSRQTYSDQPGTDSQETKAASVKALYDIDGQQSVEILLSSVDSSLEYSYDEDWSHVGICDQTACDSALFGFDWFYSSQDAYLRENQNSTLDIKWVKQLESSQIVAGVYGRDQTIDLERLYTFNDNDFISSLDTQNLAAYGQLNVSLSSSLGFIVGIRAEQQSTDYRDNTGANASPDESFWGGRIALEYRPNERDFFYGLISRGYKAGGFNLDGDIPVELREFASETMLNYEIGYKGSWLEQTLQLQAALFYQSRDDIQSKQSIVASINNGDIGGSCPCSFTDFTANATSGSNAGIELELQWAVDDRLSVFGTLGLLNTEFDEFLTYEHVNADRDNAIPYNLKGREQAHAPSYQFMFGADWKIATDWHVLMSVEGKDAFFFSDRHDVRSAAYEIINAELRYVKNSWSIGVYAKNLTNELIANRGFGSFGNDPRKFYEVEPYNQFGAPRVVGVRAQYEFE